MARIPQGFIDELIARSDIVEVIGRRVPLRKAGREFKACCPFHDEKTPSFTVSPDKQFYHCFGCGAHGTALGFLMEHDHLSFVDAIEELAGMLALEVPREHGSDGETRPSEDLFPVLDAAARFFHRQLRHNPAAIDYLKRRGLSGATAKAFGIGYAPDAWDALLRDLGQDSASSERLARAGLVAQREQQGGYYDRFRNRIMFPIRDPRGRVIAFGGRVLGEGEPKYLNSPETVLFHKGRELYGLYEMRRATRDISRLLVVEGYMDVVGLAEHGIHYAVATLGTATTAEHLRRLFRLSDEIVFCFDGDRAGRAAAWRALENALPGLREGRQLRFLFLPEGEDPDSLIRKEGAEAFEQRLGTSLPLSEFLVQRLASQVDLQSLDGRARLAELARPLLGRIPRGVYRELLLDSLAPAVGLDRNRLDSLLADPAATRNETRPAPRLGAGRGNLVRQAITLLLHHPGLAGTVESPARLGELDKPGLPLLVELLEDLRDHPGLSTAGVLERWRQRDEARHLARIAAAETLVSDEEAVEEFIGVIASLLREAPTQRVSRLIAKAGQAGLSEGEKKELRALLAARSGRQDGEPG